MSAYRNVPSDDLEPGATASAQRAPTQAEVEALVLVTGDIVPFHLEDESAFGDGALCVDAVGASAVDAQPCFAAPCHPNADRMGDRSFES